MNEDRSRRAASSNGGQQRNWFEALSHALLREPRDRSELKKLLRDAQQRNLLDYDALSMIEGVLAVSEMQVRDVMVPRTQMVVIQHDDKPENFLPHIIESAHSRFPVIGDNRDEVLGILLAKDLLSHYTAKEQGELNLRELLRPAVFIPESKRLNVLLRDFRSNRNHMAIVVDEYGGIAGLVTIEDVLEQIVGEIEDEHDIDEDTYIIKHSETRYTAKALTPIEDFNEQFGVHFPDEDYDTLGGLLIREFGHLPKRGETVTLDRFKFKILRADSRRVYLVQINVVNQTPTQEAQTGTV